ncbi:MAG: biotin/lipoyl-binding protein [Balneolaceae bacterium]|nr:biotin/lipoyl-binding protein [Balneolaceae bacterium]
MNLIRRTFLLILAIPAVLLWSVSCSNSSQQEAQSSQQVQSYPVLEIQPRSIELTSSYPATLEGLQTVEIRPRVQGYIVEMSVDEGDIVEKGEVLFQLNSEQI